MKDKLLLKTFLASVFAMEGVAFQSLSYIFCDDDFLHSLNKKYLNHDNLTDILTFNLTGISLPTVAEIYISVDRVKENALFEKTSFSDELLRVMIHGILHLCGYDDHTNVQKKKMREMENYYISKY